MSDLPAFLAWLGLTQEDFVRIQAEVEASRPAHRTDRPARGRNNARMRHEGRRAVVHAHACAAARLGVPKLPRKLKKTLWRQDPEYFC